MLRRDELRSVWRWRLPVDQVEGQTGGHRVEPQRGWARRLAGYAWRYPKDVVLALFSSLGGMAVMAIVPLITKVIIDDVIGDHPRDMAPWAGALVVAAVLVYVLTYIRRYYGGRLALDVPHDLRTEMFGTITRLTRPRHARTAPA